MISLKRKTKRLDPIIEQRKSQFDQENALLGSIRGKKAIAISAMKAKQKEYMDGVERLNSERGSANRLMLEALETGLDSIKQEWMNIYEVILKIEREEVEQLEVLSKAHRDLEAIKNLQGKYKDEFAKEEKRRDAKQIDEIASRNFSFKK